MNKPRKEKNREKFQKRDKKRPDHGHSGSGCSHRSIPGVNRLSRKEHGRRKKLEIVRRGGLAEE